MFFFEKKNQKTLALPAFRGVETKAPDRRRRKSLFGAFSSEKEQGSSFPEAKQAKRLFGPVLPPQRMAGSVKAFILLAASLSSIHQAKAVDQGQPRLPTQPLTITTKDGVRHHFTVEIAATPKQQEIGEMYRTFIPPDEGMFFDWGSPRDVAMWMQNCPVPEDMVFIGEDGLIKKIAEKTIPYSTANIDPGQPVRATLELQGGITEKLDIRVGDKVSGIIFK